MPKPIRRPGGAGIPVCVFHTRTCSWAGGELVKSDRECRQAKPDDRDRGLGVFAMPEPYDTLNDPLVRLIAEIRGNDPDEAVAKEHRRAEESNERLLAEGQRRIEQPWPAWLAEEQAKTPLTAAESRRLVDRLVAKIEAIARREADRTEENR